jgi:hypothetical protein
MKATTAVFLLFALGTAHAGDYIPPCVTTPTLYPVPVPARIDDYPAQVAGGKCGPYIIGYSAAGVVGGYWCQPDKTKRAFAVLGAARWSAVTPAMLASLASIPLAADPGEAARVHRATYVTTSFWNMPDVVCEPATDWRVRFNAAEPPILPAPPPVVWRTPATGSGTIYLTVGTKLGSIVAGKKAPPNTACACPTPPITYYTGTYCPLASGPTTEVTLCRLN